MPPDSIIQGYGVIACHEVVERKQHVPFLGLNYRRFSSVGRAVVPFFFTGFSKLSFEFFSAFNVS